VPLWKRLGSLVLGPFLLVAGGASLPQFGPTEQWLIILAVPLGLAVIWARARYERVTFGHWGDFVWGSLLGILCLLLLHALVTKATPETLGRALGGGLSVGACIGLGLGLLISALRGRFSADPVRDSDEQSGPAA